MEVSSPHNPAWLRISRLARVSIKVTAFLWLGLGACLSGSTSQAAPLMRVINGANVAEGEFPWMVSLMLGDYGRFSHFCGGVLIAPRYVVTAAHCVVGLRGNPQRLKVVSGRTRLSSQAGVVSNVTEVILHPEYDPDIIRNDIALLRLSAPLTSPTISPIRPGEEHLWLPGTPATVLGWGSTSPYANSPSDLLQKGVVSIVTDQQCRQAMGAALDPSSMLCAGAQSRDQYTNEGVDSCHGDSGGPLVVSDGRGAWKLVGLVSWGYECASLKFWGVYTRVETYAAWLTQPRIKPPSFTRRPRISGRPLVGKTLRCSSRKISGGMPLRTEYAWRAYDPAAGSDTKIENNSTTRLRITAEHLGRRIYCVVTASNLGGNATNESKLTRRVRYARSTPRR
ncbi:MAG: serine protease [Deltaproteobacteria bacterium]|nr:serine protease [Deltaproteobacteria bacterium]